MLFDQIKSALHMHASSNISGRDSKGNLITLNYIEFLEQAESLAGRLRSSGITSNSLIGMYAENCIEWLIWDFAVSLIGAKLLVFPAEMSLRSINEAATDYGLQAIVSDNVELSEIENSISLTEVDVFRCKNRSVSKHTNDSDVFTMVFSSGTSGYLKGINISKVGMSDLINEFHHAFEVTEDDSHIIFLPLSNFQQRMVFLGCLLKGVDVVISDPNSLFKDCNVFAPTFLIAPPMLYQTVYQMGSSSDSPIDVVNKFLGSNIRFLISGMAPIGIKVLEFYEQLGIPLYNVYGVVETGMISWNTRENSRLGSVGKPVKDGVLKLCEDGTIHVTRSSPLSLSYFSCKEGDQEETFISDGVVNTGDLGKVDDDGYLYIVGRTKDVIVTHGGEKLNPSEIEEQICQYPYVSDVAVFYDYDSGSIVAVVVCKKVLDAENAIRKYNDTVSKNRRIAKFTTSPNAFSPEAGTLTRNLKKHRVNISDQFFSESVKV